MNEAIKIIRDVYEETKLKLGLIDYIGDHIDKP